MSSPWTSSSAHDRDREFLVSANLFLSAEASVSIRKPAPPKKKGDKRDFSNAYTEDGRKVKEKSSWLSVARGSTAGGQWRTVTVKLTEDEERCMLNIYVDDSFLYQTVYLHLLNHTDIRQVDTSLFLKRDCIAIYSITSQRWCTSHLIEPVYLQFANRDLCTTWLTLLRSYAVPEVYGRWFFHADGGSYRMWRQVELTIIQARNLGQHKATLERRASVGGNGADSASELDAADVDVFCETKLNGILCGRTTIKKGHGFPDWHENFTFPDLPPFDVLEISIWKEKKMSKMEIMGNVKIQLASFRRGEAIDGWYPVLCTGPVAGDLHIGDMRLKLTVEEEIVLPHSSYSALLKTLNSRNLLDWMTDFDSKLKLKNLSTQLMSIAVAKNVLVEQVADLADREVESSSTKHTLFRGNTTFTKIMEACLAFYGKPFLEASIGTVVRRLCAENVAIEIDPVRSNNKSARDIEKNVDNLIYWCQEFWKQIYSVRTECPNEIRKMFAHIRKTVEKRYGASEAISIDDTPGVSWQSISAFCFLRFIVPAILHPHLFGICPGLPPVPVQRTLTLVAKSLQSLANMNINQHKEEFMRGLTVFLKESKPAMIDYIHYVSTNSSDTNGSYSGPMADRHDRLNLINTIRQRSQAMPILDREAIPMLPYLLDIPRHLAIITSAVLRTSKDFEYPATKSMDDRDRQLEELRSRCFEVEENALHRVSQLANKISAVKKPVPPPTSPLSRPPTSRDMEDAILGSSPRRVKRSGRPSTAPSDSEGSRSRQLYPVHEGEKVNTRTFARELPSPGGERSRPTGRRHRMNPKTLSTDSIPSYHRQEDIHHAHAHILPARKAAADTDTSDDGTKKKKGILRGLLARNRD